MRLSKHFTLEEMTKSMTAARKGIDNTPGSGEIHNLTEVCYNILEPLRAKFDKPVTITSGYRSEAFSIFFSVTPLAVTVELLSMFNLQATAKLFKGSWRS